MMKILLIFSIFFIFLPVNLNGSDYITKKNDEYITKKNETNNTAEVQEQLQQRVDDLYGFTLNATIGTLMHEIGHALVDAYDIPIFANEEDIADSFLTYYLINLPSDFKDQELYKHFSEMDHGVLMDTADYYYFNTLLGKDLSDDFSSHSTDNRRFFNILCNMKSGNSDFFDEYLTKRDIGYLIDDKCKQDFNEMRDSWFEYIGDYWLYKDDGIYNQFNISFEENYESFIDETFIEKFIDYFNETYGLTYLDYFQIKLPYQVEVNFKSCDEANAFYNSQKPEIIVCYELIEEYFLTRFRILELKDSL